MTRFVPQHSVCTSSLESHFLQGGVTRCGPTIAAALARCGFGDSLVNAFLTLPPDSFPTFLRSWRAELCQELRTNSRGLITKKYVSLANSIPDSFPNIEVLRSYVTPVTSESRGKIVDDSKWWTRDMDIAEVASCCEQFFEWGIKEIILKRFRTVLWPGACLRILRQAAREQDMKGQTAHTLTPQKNAKRPPKHLAVGTPSKLITRYFSKLGLDSPEKVRGPLGDDQDDEDPLMIKIHSSRQHASTDKILEYRVEVAPAQLAALAESGVQGLRSMEHMDLGDTFSDLEPAEEDEEEGGSKKKRGPKPPPDPKTHLRVWLPACMLEYVQPRLVEEWEAKEEAKRAKKEGKGKGRKKAVTEEDGDDEPKKTKPAKKSPAKTKAKEKAPAKPRRKIWESSDESDEGEEGRIPARPTKAPVLDPNPRAAVKAGAVARARSALFASDDEVEEASDADVPSRLKKPSPPPNHKAVVPPPPKATTKPAPQRFKFTMPCPDDDEEEEEAEMRSPSPTLLFRAKPPAPPPAPAPAQKPKPVAKAAAKPKPKAPRTNAVADFFNDSFSSDGEVEEASEPATLRPPHTSRASSSSSSTAVSGSSTAVSSSDVPSKAKVSRKAQSPVRGSSSEPDGPRKSPRKSPEQTSPRKSTAKLQSRSPSPSPKRPLKAKAPPPTKVMEYIEISSSSDDEPAPPPPRARSTSSKPVKRPVLAAKKPAQKELGFAVKKAAKPAATKPVRSFRDENLEFIDLT